MANLYVADDGTIHDHDIEHQESVNSFSLLSDLSTHAMPYISSGRKVSFWILTVGMSLLVGYLLYSTIGIQLFEKVSNPHKLVEYLENFFCIITPFVIVGGAVICTIIYGTKCAESHSYNFGAYFLSVLSATGGAVGAGIVIFLLFYIIAIALYILFGVIIIAIIAAIIGGS